MSRECKRKIEKVNETWEICGKSFGRGEKPWVRKGRIPLTP